MPGMDGHELLKKIRDSEESKGLTSKERVNIFMTTGISDPKSVLQLFYDLCDEYLSKPVDNTKLTALLIKHALI
jgi:two-component system chemotaxis response regulator CheY